MSIGQVRDRRLGFTRRMLSGGLHGHSHGEPTRERVGGRGLGIRPWLARRGRSALVFAAFAFSTFAATLVLFLAAPVRVGRARPWPIRAVVVRQAFGALMGLSRVVLAIAIGSFFMARFVLESVAKWS